MEVASSSNAVDDSFTISIRSIHVKTPNLRVPKHWTVGQLKAKVRCVALLRLFLPAIISFLPVASVSDSYDMPSWGLQIIEIEQLKHKQVRIIYHGRDLQDGVLLADAGIREGSNVHVSVSNKAPQSRQNARAAPSTGGRAMPNANDSDSEEEELSGFDRLREMGFSADDVQQIRTQFSLNHFRNLPTGQAFPAPQSPEMLQLENLWIDSQFNPNQANNPHQQQQQQPRQNQVVDGGQRATVDNGIDIAAQLASLGSVDGNGYNLLTGLIIGFLLGLISLIWIGEPSLTRKTRLGMFAGIFANIVLGFLASYTTG